MRSRATRPLTPRRLGWLALAVTAWGATALLLVSDGAVSIAPDMLVLYVGAAVAGMATLAWVVAGAAGGPPDHRRRWPWLAYAAAVIAVVPSLCRYMVPFRLRFAGSEAALEAAARSTPRGQRSDERRRIGLLWVDAVDTVGPATRFFTGACDVGERCGVVHSPGAPPPPREGTRYAPLRGPWWSVAERR